MQPYTARQMNVTWQGMTVIMAFLVVYFVFIDPNPTSVSWKDNPGGARNEGTLFNQVLWPALLMLSIFTVAASGKIQWLATQFDFLLVICLAWFLFTTSSAIDPGISIRRYFFMFSVLVACISIFGSMSDRQILIVFMVLVIGDTVMKYGFLAFVRQGKHLADGLEPHLAGLWRGQYAHKNTAGAASVADIILLLGMGSVLHVHFRYMLIAAQVVFLIFSGAKTPVYLFIIILLISEFCIRNRNALVNIVFVAVAIAALNFVTIGSIVSDAAAVVAQKIVGDASFTGRIELWKMLIGYIGDHPILGAGFQSFWQIGNESPAKRLGGTWTASAFYGHQGFLDIAAGTGLVGLALALCFLIIRPMFDLHYIKGNANSVVRMYTGLWLFGLFENLTESLMFAKADPIWVLTIAGIAGLRKTRFAQDFVAVPADVPEPRRQQRPLQPTPQGRAAPALLRPPPLSPPINPHLR